MSFLWPAALGSLLLVPFLAVLYVLLQRRRQRLRTEYASLGSALAVAGRGPGFLRHLPPVLLLAGLSILLAASARPFTQVALPRVEGTVVLAFDVSGSMAADDIQPTRMEAAKAAARAFVEQQPSTVQIGIVAFSDSGFSVQVPTNDKDEVLASINRLSPQRGTSLANGILVSLKTIIDSNTDSPTHFYSNVTPQAPAPSLDSAGRFDSAVIVLLSDGENNQRPDPVQAAQSAASHGVRIYTVGLGSTNGTSLHINGFTVHTQLDEQSLQQIAQLTGGTYYNAASAPQLASVYTHLDPRLVVRPEKTEVTSIFAGASAALLLLGGLLSLFWFRRLP